MLTIEVTTIGGAPPPVPMAARFDQAGGAIGRDAACALMLPDPEKRISRAHCLVSFESGHYSVRNQGSALPMLLNDVPVAYGAQVPVGEGDRIVVGEYAMVVHGGGARGDASPAIAGPVVVEPRARQAATADILSDFGPASSADPFADLIPRAAPVQAKVRPATPQALPGRAPSTVQAQIPDDFDPFAEPPAAETPAADRREIDDLVPGGKASVDELFGLKGAPMFPPGHPLAPGSASSTPDAVGIDDLLQTAPRKTSQAPVQRDDAPELSTPMRLPDFAPAVALARVNAKPATPAPIAEPTLASTTAVPAASPTAAGGDMKLSWEDGADAGVFDGQRSVLITGQDTPATDGRSSVSAAPEAVDASAGASSAALDPALVAALLDGLGLERWPGGKAPDAEAMRRLGRLLRSAVRGTIDLLRARATIKSEVQAELTMVVDVNNNPLKFSPNVEAALAHLLAPAQRGFIEGTDAMDDAYRDLVAHQFGFTAGTRAAIAAMLARFDPAALQLRLTSKSVLDSVLPDHRKAKLWALFTEQYGQIAGDAEDDFQRLFGKAFLRAYEEQVAKLGENASAQGR